MSTSSLIGDLHKFVKHMDIVNKGLSLVVIKARGSNLNLSHVDLMFAAPWIDDVSRYDSIAYLTEALTDVLPLDSLNHIHGVNPLHTQDPFISSIFSIRIPFKNHVFYGNDNDDDDDDGYTYVVVYPQP